MGGKSSPEYHAEYYQSHKPEFRAYRKKFKESEIGKDCERKYRVKRIFNLTREQHLAILEKQNFKCAFPDCGENVTLFSSLDHNHACCPGNKSCGVCVRGVLCRSHNSGLSFFESKPLTLLNAFRYLEENKTCLKTSSLQEQDISSALSLPEYSGK
jgi:hypothetical protein